MVYLSFGVFGAITKRRLWEGFSPTHLRRSCGLYGLLVPHSFHDRLWVEPLLLDSKIRRAVPKKFYFFELRSDASFSTSS